MRGCGVGVQPCAVETPQLTAAGSEGGSAEQGTARVAAAAAEAMETDQDWAASGLGRDQGWAFGGETHSKLPTHMAANLRDYSCLSSEP